MKVERLALPRAGIFYGWWVLLSISIIGGLAGGVYSYGFSVFFLPLSTDLGLSRAATSLVMAASRLEGGLYGAVVGWLIDRHGARPLLLLGGILAGIGFIVLSRVDSFLFFAFVYLAILSGGVNAGIFHPAAAAINTWFVRRKATALGALSAAYGIGGALMAPLLGLGIYYFGWRTTSLVAGVVLILVIPALALGVRRSPEAMGLRPDGDPAPLPGRSASPAAEFTVRDAMRTTSLWLLTVAVTMRFFVQGAIMVHLVPLLIDKGVPDTIAAGMMGMLALFSIPTRFGTGWLGDRFSKRYILMAGVATEITGMLILLAATQTWHLYLFVAIYAFGYGGSMLGWAMLGEYYGRRSFATLRGLVGLVYTWGSVAGPIFAGWMFDRTQSYQMAVMVMIAIYAPALLLYWLCRKPAAPVPAPA